MNTGTIVTLLNQASDMIPDFLSIATSSNSLDEMDFTELLNDYVKVQNLWSELQREVSEGLKLIGDYITDTVVCDTVKEPSTVLANNADTQGRYLALIQGIKSQLESLEIKVEEIKPERNGYVTYSNGFKIISNPEINRHGDHSFSILITKKLPNGNSLSRIYATVNEAVEFIVARR